jgi:hypothetical protein
LPYTDENKLIKYLAVSTGFAVCLTRISTALSNIATGVSLLLAFLIWYSHNDSFSLSEEVKGYMKAYGIFVLLTVFLVVHACAHCTGYPYGFRF